MRLGVASFALAVVVAAGLLTYAVQVNISYAYLLFAPLVIMCAATFPRIALLSAVPVLLYPDTVDVAGYSAAAPLLAMLEVGIVIGCLPRLRQVALPAALAAAIAITLVVSYVSHGPAMIVTVTEARNSLMTLILNLALVPVAALANPGGLATLKAIGLSAVVMTAYSFTYGSSSGGRLSAMIDINPNATGHISAVTTVVLLSLFLAERRVRWIVLSAAPLMLLIASQSRGALVVLAVGLVALVMLNLTGRARTLTILGGGAALFVLWEVIPAVLRLLLSVRDQRYLSNDGRFSVLRLALELLAENPVTGIGYRHFMDYSSAVVGIPLNTHNDYLRIGAEAGLPALLLLLVLAARGVFFPGRGREHQAVRASMIAALTSGLFINAMTDLRVSLPMWLLLGVVWASSDAVRQRGAAGVSDTVVHSWDGSWPSGWRRRSGVG